MKLQLGKFGIALNCKDYTVKIGYKSGSFIEMIRVSYAS